MNNLLYLDYLYICFCRKIEIALKIMYCHMFGKNCSEKVKESCLEYIDLFDLFDLFELK